MDLTNHIVVLKTGDEKLTSGEKELDFSLLDFWRWSVSDILSNATRGILAEFIVAKALGIDTSSVRREWDAFDLITPHNVRIEVKSSAYLQSWEQIKYSDIRFGCAEAREWDYNIDKRSGISKRHADVYVFCLLKHLDKSTVNPLNLDQWEFYVIATPELLDKIGKQKTISLSTLKKLTLAISYDDVSNAVQAKLKYSISDAIPKEQLIQEADWAIEDEKDNRLISAKELKDKIKDW